MVPQKGIWRTDGNGCTESLGLGSHLTDRVGGGNKPALSPSHRSLLHPPLPGSLGCFDTNHQYQLPPPTQRPISLTHWPWGEIFLRAEAAVAPQGRFPAGERRAGSQLRKLCDCMTLSTVWLWTIDLTSLCLSFSSVKWISHKDCCEDSYMKSTWKSSWHIASAVYRLDVIIAMIFIIIKTFCRYKVFLPLFTMKMFHFLPTNSGDRFYDHLHYWKEKK